MDELLGQSPFGRLLDIPGVDGAEDIFGNVGIPGQNSSDGGSSPFGMGSSTSGTTNLNDLPYGGNPFAGDNFWNIFAGGVNPSNVSMTGGNNSFAGF